MKPNVMRKWFFSDILDMRIRCWVSMKARRCIMKRGSFDNYLMHTKEQQIDSRFGIYLRGLMKSKLKNPEAKVPYIPGQCRLPRTTTNK